MVTAVSSVAACGRTTAPPLLVLGMYDRSHHMDFGTAAGRYVDAFMANVSRDEVSRRVEWARKSARV